jgi:peptidoglycan/LPS O-acetylase OafA/YrhL
VRIQWANSLRGIAAVSVVIAHLALMFWLNPDVAVMLSRQPNLLVDAEDPPVFAKVLQAIPLDFAALGVSLFFLLSGFVIALSLGVYSRRAFLVGRIFRIFPTYAAGYLVTCAVVYVIGDPGHEITVSNVLAGAIPGLANVLRVGAVADGVVWTLIVELIFYVFCVAFYRRLISGWKGIALLAGLCLTGQALANSLLYNGRFSGVVFVFQLAFQFIPIMLAGVTISNYYRGKISLVSFIILLAAMGSAYFYMSGVSVIAPTGLKYRVTYLVVILAFASVALWGKAWRGGLFFEGLAGVSYALYVVHLVLGFAVMAQLLAAGVDRNVALVVAVVVVFAAATAIHFAVEKPTHRIGRFLAHRIDAKERAAAQATNPAADPVQR